MHGPCPEETWPGTWGRYPPHLGEAVGVNLQTAWWPTGHCGTESQPSQSAPTGSHYSTVSAKHTDRQEERDIFTWEERENRHCPFEWTKKLADTGLKLNSRPANVPFFPPSLTNWFGRASGAGLIKRRCRPGYAVELALFEKHSMQ